MDLPATLQAGQWQPIQQGLSGASIFRGTLDGRACFLKITPHTHCLPVKAEFARIQWLKTRVPVADVITYLENDTHQYLVTAAVPGVELLEYDADPDILIRIFADAIRLFHDLPTEDCPFTWTVDEQLAFARRTLENKEVQVSLLDTEFRGRSLDDLFREMVAHRPDSLDIVVVHGDPYHDNILVNPNTGEVAAFIDVGNTGVADRYTDLAMIYDNIVHAFSESGWERFLQRYGLKNFDSKKMYFYRLFNEFM